MSFSILAHHWEGSHKLKFPIQNALVSKKYNGWNIIYDGGVSEGLRTKQVPWVASTHDTPASGFCTIGRATGPKPIYPPEWWSAGIRVAFKGVPIQGELWHPSDDHNVVKSIAGQGYVKSINDERWAELVLIPCNIKPYHMWTELFSSFQKGLLPAAYEIVRNSDHYLDSNLESKLNKINTIILSHEGKLPIFSLQQYSVTSESEIVSLSQSIGGEGIMVTHSNAKYTLGRSHHLLKIKGQWETEATVVSYEAGKDRNEGAVGSLICQLTWDDKVASVYGGNETMVGKEVTFRVSGLSDSQRPLEYFRSVLDGSVINFTYLGVTQNGTPVSANIIAIV